MESTMVRKVNTRAGHPWLRKIAVAFVPGPDDAGLDEILEPLLGKLQVLGQRVLDEPRGQVDLVLTSAAFGEPVSWRQAPMFSARRRFGLDHTPTVVTLLKTDRGTVDQALARLEAGLQSEEPAPEMFAAAGLAPQSWRVLLEQGRRGGPILSLLRQVQAQTMCIRNILLVEQAGGLSATYFDLVGAHPRIECDDPDDFYEDMALRLVTAVSTREITNHRTLEPAISRERWEGLATPGAMITAAKELDQRHFFTEMIRINDLVHVPALEDAVSSQYSEGCFATWDPQLGALIATITGSARPVDKGRITEDDLAVICGVRKDGLGALVQEVEGKQNDPPSSEAVELMDMDSELPRIPLENRFTTEVPVSRSKLHGHRGVQSFDPALVEFVALDLPYHDYPVSCSTDAQARAIKQAFSRSEALQHPDDPRSIAFTILPGHGLVLVEKWVEGNEPFEILWQAMDAGTLEISNHIPQGRHRFVPDGSGRMALSED